MPDSDRVPRTLRRALAARGYRDLTPVQSAVCAAEPRDADMLVSASTGSGKTVACGLSLASVLLDDAGMALPGGPRAVAVMPVTDCDDTDANINPDTVWYLDADNDNYAVSSVTQCANPPRRGG